ncbi:MAG: CDP-diacylglycerol--glycerol-3-phosphate 3-phosphatidyltransferase [Luteolibacter sp.]
MSRVAIASGIVHSPIVNLPNSITVARLLLTGVFVAGAAQQSLLGHWIALAAFVIAAISDFLDGYLARKLNLVTNMGKLLDPLADKILVSAAYIYLSATCLCPVWVTVVIIGREFLVTGLRQLAVEAGQVIAADNLGKWKTTAQLSYCISCLLFIALQGMDSTHSGLIFLVDLVGDKSWLQPVTLWASLILTVWSGWNYTWNARGLILKKG